MGAVAPTHLFASNFSFSTPIWYTNGFIKCASFTLAPRNLRRRSSAAIKTGNPTAGRPHAKMCDSPKIKTSTPTKKKPEEEDDEDKKEPPLTPSQRKRSEEEIILSAPASAQSAKSKDSPEKEPKSKKQKRQSEKLKCISSPKPIGI